LTELNQPEEKIATASTTGHITGQANRCPCGSQRRFAYCCQPLLQGDRTAPTAEALMRSRYSAFATGQIDYLLTTQALQDESSAHDSHQRERQALSQTIQSVEWVGLSVIATQKGKAADTVGFVEFVAAFQSRQPKLSNLLERPTEKPTERTPTERPIEQLHERSRFEKRAGCWQYVGGDILPPYQPKRTEPCWCGSGKKFKQCHG
jgi:SEC-C motif domain protein